MAHKSVLIVENEDLQRVLLEKELRVAGFDVASARDARTARSLVERRESPFDVVVLDMHLPGESVTGAQLGIEFMKRRSWRERPPEFLINSAFNWKEYFELALKLGAAAYLRKEQSDLYSVVRHVRALALRRALTVEHPAAVEDLRQIARSSYSLEEVHRRFCADFICAELQRTLDHPFLLLLTLSSGTVAFTNVEDSPRRPESGYSLLQALTFGKTDQSTPFILALEDLRPQTTLSMDVLELLRDLNGSAFVSLSQAKEVKLSVGIRPRERDRAAIEEAHQLAHLLGQYFKPAVLTGLLKVGAAFSELDQRRREVLRATAQFCLYVGQEQIASLDAAVDSGELPSEGNYLDKLRNLAESLVSSGSLLGDLEQAEREGLAGDGGSAAKSLLSMTDVVANAWLQVRPMVSKEHGDILRLEGDCAVQGNKEYLLLAVKRVLQWFVQRLHETPANEEPGILVECLETKDGPVVTFRDHSRRLPPKLREHLFAPFSRTAFHLPSESDLAGPGLHLSLYLAKMLVDLGNGGVLDDRSDASDSEAGHRLVMRFPPVSQSLAA